MSTFAEKASASRELSWRAIEACYATVLPRSDPRRAPRAVRKIIGLHVETGWPLTWCCSLYLATNAPGLPVVPDAQIMPLLKQHPNGCYVLSPVGMSVWHGASQLRPQWSDIYSVLGKPKRLLAEIKPHASGKPRRKPSR